MGKPKRVVKTNARQNRKALEQWKKVGRKHGLKGADLNAYAIYMESRYRNSDWTYSNLNSSLHEIWADRFRDGQRGDSSGRYEWKGERQTIPI